MRPAYVIGGVALALLWLVAVASGGGNQQRSTAPAATTTADAYDACQQFVLKRLKSPSTAKFPSISEVKPFKEAEHFTVIGYVDSQNSFGAMIRTSYTCSVEPAPGDKMRLIALDL